MEEEFGREGGAYAGCLGDGAGLPTATNANGNANGNGKSDADAGAGYEADEGNERDGVVWRPGIGIDVDVDITKRLVRHQPPIQLSTPPNPNPNPKRDTRERDAVPAWPRESKQRPRPRWK